MRINVWSVVVTAVLGVALLSGCSRKPKLDLTGLRATGAGTGEGVMEGAPGFDATAFDPFAAGGGAGALAPDTAGGEGWGEMDKPLGGAGGGAGSIVPTTERWAQVVVYFAYDSAVIGPAERPKLETLAGHLQQYANYAVVIEGHCDERGSDEYNRALGQQRAIVVRDHLCAEGVTEGRIETVSYGEERPAVANATGESGHAKNRRAEFLLGPLK